MPLLRNNIQFLLLAALILGSAGCGGRKDAGGSPSLVYWSSNNPDEILMARQVVDTWNRLRPDVPVKFQPIPEGESSEEIILAAVVGKTTPDVYSNMWPGDVESYVRAGQLVRLDTFPDFSALADERLERDILDESRSGDSAVYQIFWKTCPIMLMYNRGMFRKIGYDRPPATYEEFLRAAAKMTEDSDGDGYTDRWIGVTDIRARWRDRLFDFYPFYVAATGGKTLITNGRIAFDNASAVAVFSFFRTLFEKQYFPREMTTGHHDFFLAGLAASRITGPWEIARAEKLKPEGLEYGFSPIPTPEASAGPVYTYGNPKSIVIFRNTRHPKSAWEFAKYLVSLENDKLLLEMASQIPIRKDLLGIPEFMPYFDKNPKMVAFAGQARYIRNEDSCTCLKDIFDAISQEFEACVVYRTKTPELAVHEAAARSALLME